MFGKVDFMVLTTGLSGSIGKVSFCVRREFAQRHHQQPCRAESDHGTCSGFAADQDHRDHVRTELQILNHTGPLSVISNAVVSRNPTDAP